MEQEIRRTVQIKLRQTPEQTDEIEKLFSAFGIGLNFSLKQIEDAYRKAMAKYIRVEEVDGVCAGCGKERPLIYSSGGKLFCNSCVMREYSEYTVRGMSISTSQRPVDNDIKTAVEVENKTHVHMMFSQAYGTWKSFNAWRNKREFERKWLEEELSELKKSGDKSYSAAVEIWERAKQIQKEGGKKITRLHAMAMASKEIYALYRIEALPPTLEMRMDRESKERCKLYPDVSQRSISRVVNKLRELNYMNRPIHFPEYENVASIQLHKNFVTFKDGKLHVSLFHKKNNGQVIDFYGNEYLNQFLSEMEEDNAVYTNLIKRVDGKKVSYYLMYPLTVKRNIPTIYDMSDVFTIGFSPDGILVHGRYNGNGNNGNKMEESQALVNLKKEKSIIPFTEINSDGQSLVWFRLGNLLNAKQHFHDKRVELMEHNTRNSLRRVKKMGNAEQRATRTFNHQLSHFIVEYIADRSEMPLIIMWDMTSGITADYGKTLNRIKKMWPVVQQQQFIKHKAFLRCVPVKMVQYNKQNVLTCSFCHRPFKKKDEFGKDTKDTIKTITALLRRVKNIKCERCGHELNMLINQARILSAFAVEPEKGA